MKAWSSAMGKCQRVMKDHLQRLGLKAVSSHVSIERLRDHLDQEIAYNRDLGNDTLVSSSSQGF